MKQPRLFDKSVVVERATSLGGTVKFKLEPENDPEALMDLLKPFEGEPEAYKVDKRVGRVRENDVGLLGKRDTTPVSEEPKA